MRTTQVFPQAGQVTPSYEKLSPDCFNSELVMSSACEINSLPVHLASKDYCDYPAFSLFRFQISLYRSAVGSIRLNALFLNPKNHGSIIFVLLQSLSSSTTASFLSMSATLSKSSSEVGRWAITSRQCARVKSI